MKRLLVCAVCLTAAPVHLNAQIPRSEKVSPLLWDLAPAPASPGGGRAVAPKGILTPATPPVIQSARVPTQGQFVVVNAIAEDSAETLAQQLRDLGATHVATAGRVVSAQLPLAAIPHLPALSSLRFARPAIAFAMDGRTVTQGDTAQYSDAARSALGATGAGVRVGILSDSFNNKGGMNNGILYGDLPADILILKDYVPPPGGYKLTDEGRAMGEIVHDVAPGAALAFHTAWYGVADFANGIRALAKAGCKVIVDDILYPEEPMFADGVIAQAVDEVTAQGVAYFSAAANAARNSYEAPYREANGYHDFDPGAGVDTMLNLTLGYGTTYFMLQWVDNYASAAPGNPGAATDLDLELVNLDGTPVATTTTSGQTVPVGGFSANLGQDPVEVFAISVSALNQKRALRVKRVAGPAPAWIKIVWYPLFQPPVQEEWVTQSGTIYGHANAAGAMAVGAVRYCHTPAYGVNPPLLESYSSAGGTPIYRRLADGSYQVEIRPKPDFCAPSGVNTSFFGSGDTCGVVDPYPNFHGTSAAAPHAAGIAALMLEVNPQARPERIRWILQATALDMREPGFDFDSGYGLVDAHAALTVLTTPPPMLVAAASRKAHGPAGAKVNYDQPLVLSGRPTIEGRIESTLRVVFTFDKPILSATPLLLRGSASLSATPVVDGATVLVQLDRVADRQWVTVGLKDILATDGSQLDRAEVSVGVLGGDVNNTPAVNTTDLYLIRLVAGSYVNASNFTRDLNLSGAINTADVYLVQQRTGRMLPAWQ